MTDTARDPESQRRIDAWLQRQSLQVREGIRTSVDLETGAVRDAGPGEPVTGGLDCLRRMAEFDRVIPSVRYFKIAHDLLDKAGTLAFQLGVAHYENESGLLSFLSLAGTALFGDRAGIARFERSFGADAALDEVILFFQAELEMLDGGFPAD